LVHDGTKAAKKEGRSSGISIPTNGAEENNSPRQSTSSRIKGSVSLLQGRGQSAVANKKRSVERSPNGGILTKGDNQNIFTRGHTTWGTETEARLFRGLQVSAEEISSGEARMGGGICSDISREKVNFLIIIPTTIIKKEKKKKRASSKIARKEERS